jgi:hypothetical protein
MVAKNKSVNIIFSKINLEDIDKKHPHGLRSKQREGSMEKYLSRTVCFLILILLISTGGLGRAEDEKPRDMQGWGIDDPYNKLYDIHEYEKIRAWVIRVKEVVPMPGMSPATALDVREGSDEFEVQICPTWYRKPSEIRLQKDARIKLKGVWAEINGKDVFLASKIKKDPDIDIIKVRLTRDGTPFWTMTPERLAKEMSQDDD